MTTTLQHLRQLHQQATPGPWNSDTLEDGECNLECHVDGLSIELGTLNYPFIAAMRNALPALLDIAEAAQHVINNDAAITDSKFHGSPSYDATYGRLREALDRLNT